MAMFKDVTTSAQEARAALSNTAAAFRGVGRKPIVGEGGGGEEGRGKRRTGKEEKRERGWVCHRRTFGFYIG